MRFLRPCIIEHWEFTQLKIPPNFHSGLQHNVEAKEQYNLYFDTIIRARLPYNDEKIMQLAIIIIKIVIAEVFTREREHRINIR